MFKIKKLFRGLTLSSEFEKSLSKIKQSRKCSLLKEKDIFHIQEALQGHDPLVPKEQAYTLMIGVLADCTNAVGCLKFLYLMHLLLYRLEDPFVQEMKLHRMNNFSNFLKFSPQKELGIIICYYYRFFYTVCSNFEYFRHAVRYLDTGSVENFLKLTLAVRLKGLIKLLRILIFISRVIKVLEFALIKHSTPLIRVLASFILNDFQLIYDFVQCCVTKEKESIFTLDSGDAQTLYSIYQDTIRVTRELQKFYQLRYLISDHDLKQPKFFLVNVEDNKKIELYMKDQQKQHALAQQTQNLSACELIVNQNFIIEQTHHQDEKTFSTSSQMIQLLFDGHQDYALLQHDDF